MEIKEVSDRLNAVQHVIKDCDQEPYMRNHFLVVILLEMIAIMKGLLDNVGEKPSGE